MKRYHFHNFQLLLLFNHSVVLNSLRSHGLQDVRLPCPSLSFAVCSNSCPLSQWCHPTISFSVTHFSSCPQSFLASRSSPITWLFICLFQLHRSLGQLNCGPTQLYPKLFLCLEEWMQARNLSPKGREGHDKHPRGSTSLNVGPGASLWPQPGPALSSPGPQQGWVIRKPHTKPAFK